MRAVFLAVLLFTSLPAGLAEAVENPMNYGAKGDGRADDTAAIQAAIKAARTRDRKVILPPGIFVVSRTIAVEDVSIHGNSNEAQPDLPIGSGGHSALSTRIAPNGRNFGVFQLMGEASLKDLSIWYPSPAATNPTFATPAAIAIRLGGIGEDRSYRTWTRSTLRNLDIRNAYRGISTDPAYPPTSPSPSDQDYSGNVLDHVLISGNVDWAVYLNWQNASTLDVTNLIITAEWRSPSAKGLYLDNTLRFTIANSEVSKPYDGNALVVYNTRQLQSSTVINGLRMESNYLRTHGRAMVVTRGYRDIVNGAEILTLFLKLAEPQLHGYLFGFSPTVPGSTLTLNQVEATSTASRLMTRGRFFKARLNSSNGTVIVNDPSIRRHDLSVPEANLSYTRDRAIHRIQAAPATGTWVRNDVALGSAASAGWRCTESGTFGTLSGVTTATIKDSQKLFFATPPPLQIGDYLAIDGITGKWLVTGVNLLGWTTINGVSNTTDCDPRGTVTVINSDGVTPLPSGDSSLRNVRFSPPVFQPLK